MGQTQDSERQVGTFQNNYDSPVNMSDKNGATDDSNGAAEQEHGEAEEPPEFFAK